MEAAFGIVELSPLDDFNLQTVTFLLNKHLAGRPAQTNNTPDVRPLCWLARIGRLEFCEGLDRQRKGLSVAFLKDGEGIECWDKQPGSHNFFVVIQYRSGHPSHAHAGMQDR